MLALVLGLLTPPLMLLGLLWMARVERALPTGSLGDRVADFLDTADPDELEAYVVDGLGPALDRYWRRRRMARLVPLRDR